MAIAYLCAHRYDQSNPTTPYPVRPPFPVDPNMLPAPEDLAKHDGLPSWLQLGLMKYASRSKIDRDELFYCSDLVRKNGGKCILRRQRQRSGTACSTVFVRATASLLALTLLLLRTTAVTEFFVDFSCYSEYFSNADVTLVSGSSDLQATR